MQLFSPKRGVKKLTPLRPPLHPSCTKEQIKEQAVSSLSLRLSVHALCTKLQNLSPIIHLQTRKYQRRIKLPTRFTFTIEEILRSNQTPLSSIVITTDWRHYPSPAIRLLNARQLAKRISQRV